MTQENDWSRRRYRNDKFANTLALAEFAGPHHWNDPDSLEVGNGHLTLDQERLHFSLWCLMAAPLIAGTASPDYASGYKIPLHHQSFEMTENMYLARVLR